jgi:transposase InsO family protein
VELREEFVLRAREKDANVSALCREYSISRKTGYKWLERYDSDGVDGLRDLSRRPRRPLSVSGESVLQVLEARARHPHWGPKKLVAWLKNRGEEAPSVRTAARILERAGVERLRKRRRALPSSAAVERPTQVALEPNDVWTVDFKGWWKTKDGARAEPLTVRDAASRFVLCVTLVASASTEVVRKVFVELFTKCGLPKAIQVDNGAPFASTRARAGLTKLSAWWLSLGIKVIRSRPGHPQDNGAHERMHLDMCIEVEQRPGASKASQQRELARWRDEYNNERPHEALQMAVPASVYRRSARKYRGPQIPNYPLHYIVRTVGPNGRVRMGRRGSVFISAALDGLKVGLEPLADESLRAWFFDLDLGVLAASDFTGRAA